MIKKYCLALLVLISTGSMMAQIKNLPSPLSAKTVRAENIKDRSFREVYQYFQTNGFLELPVTINRDFKRKDRQKLRPYPLRKDNELFFVNMNKKDYRRNDKETKISYMFSETNGDYVMGIVTAISADHHAVKSWLVTFNLSGHVIDYLPIRESLGGDMVRTIESHIYENFIVDLQQLSFPNNDYIIEKEVLVNDLKGQRVDRSFIITTEGKFKKTKEVCFLPQIYSDTTLLDKTILIHQRGENAIK